MVVRAQNLGRIDLYKNGKLKDILAPLTKNLALDDLGSPKIAKIQDPIIRPKSAKIQWKQVEIVDQRKDPG